MRGSDFAELRAFAVIVEHGSFTRAAAQLGISASALSQTQRNLETRLGTSAESHHAKCRADPSGGIAVGAFVTGNGRD
ncbi:hypothetical protein M2406_003334 [Serratia sp. BIGb0163]|nr:hypothetical protein [Serratia sp. BIGb0163]